MNQIGKYTILEALGQGGMGTVYRAQDPILGREVAVKTIQDAALKNPKTLQRFYTEARSAGQLSHENITVIHDFGEDDGRLYIVMEMLGGTDLNALIFYHHPLALDLVFSIAVQICRGLHAAHQRGIIHRDIKPGNIRVLESGRVKIMDFGLARVSSGSLTQTHSRVGTPQYMAPEQVRGDDIDHRVDIFAFGLILYEMLTGERAYDGEHMSRVVYSILEDDLPPINYPDLRVAADLQRLVSRCTAKDPRQRYPHFEAVIQDLNRAATKLRQPMVTVAAPGLVEAAISRAQHHQHTPLAQPFQTAQTAPTAPPHTASPFSVHPHTQYPATVLQATPAQVVPSTLHTKPTQAVSDAPTHWPSEVDEEGPKRSAVLVAALIFTALSVLGGITYTVIQLVQADGPPPTEQQTTQPTTPLAQPANPSQENPAPEPPVEEPVLVERDVREVELGAYIHLTLVPRSGPIASLRVTVDGTPQTLQLEAATPLTIRFRDRFLIDPTHLHALRIRLEDAIDYPTSLFNRRPDGSVLITRQSAQQELDKWR